jgi:hypothetical protein
MAQVVGGLATQGFTPDGGTAQVQVPWKVTGGGYDGAELSIKGLEATYTKTLDYHQQVLDDAFFLGYAPSGNAAYLNLIISVESDVSSSDPSVIPMEEASAQLLGQTPAARDADVLAGILPTLKFKGAIPETLFLYDFSGHNTNPSAELAYVNQFEQADLPVRFHTTGGNACGPSSLTMALEPFTTPPAVSETYDHTMEKGLAVLPETEQGFDWEKGERWAQTSLGTIPSVAITQGNNNWAEIQGDLKWGAQVLLRTDLGLAGGTKGSGHVILLVGVGDDADVKARLKQLDPDDKTGDYFIVADPAGNYFADADHGGLNQGHYGTVSALRGKAKGITYGGRFAVYPKAKLQQYVSTMRTLTIMPLEVIDPPVDVEVHSPVSVVITDPLGRKTGIRPDGSVLEEIPSSEYQVAVREEEESGLITFDPEEQKGVLISKPVAGTYQVELVGTGTGPYTLDITTGLRGQPPSTTTYTGTATPGATAHYTFTVAGAGAPQVQQVFADSTAWSPSFRQFMQTTGAGDGALGYRVNAGDTLPWVNVDRLVLRFDRELPASPLPAKVTIDGTRADYAATPSVLDARTILLTLDRPLSATGGDRLRLADDGLGGSPDFRFNILPGDVDRSGTVLANDFSQVKQKFFSGTSNPGSGASAYSIFHDVNGSGSILADDFSAVKSRFFNTLPGAGPTAATVAAAGRRVTAVRESVLGDDSSRTGRSVIS